jgi:hypothetical protein
MSDGHDPEERNPLEVNMNSKPLFGAKKGEMYGCWTRVTPVST